jgi:3-hydroxy-9,10-secoandrosta-1,3,5(10)-triene-9,17-dione monooxygenase
MNKTAQRPFSPENKGNTLAVVKSPTLLTPVVQSRSVDVSDISDMPGLELRKVLVERAKDLFPLLDANANITEQNRRVVDDNIAAIRAAGIYRSMVPRRFGGLQTDIRTGLEICRELGKACGSTSWVTTLLNGCAFLAGLSSAECQNDIWGENPDARIAGVFTPLGVTKRVPGGYVVTGKWPWASGCLHADWALVGMPVVNDAGEETGQGFAFIPMAEITIEDTWFVSGMKGTGSNTLVASEVFIPDHRVISVSRLLAGDPPTRYKDEILYRSSFIPTVTTILTGPQLGLCSRALEFVIEKAPKRSISYTFYKTQTESPSFQIALAKAAMLVDTAHLHAYRAADEIYRAASENRFMSYPERARTRMDAGYVGQVAREAIGVLISAHGASSFADISPMQRIWRDSETGGRHAVIAPDIGSEIYGRALLGYTEGITVLV